MEIERNEEKKIISIWLTKAESQDEDLQRRLKAMYPKRNRNPGRQRHSHNKMTNAEEFRLFRIL